MVPLFPSASAADAAIEIDGSASSFVIVPVAEPEPASVAFVGPDRLIVKASFVSTAVSPTTCTMACRDVCPGLKVTVPVAET